MIDWPVTQPTLSVNAPSLTLEQGAQTLGQHSSIILRPLCEDDIDPIFQACQDPTISAFTRVPFPYEREMAEEFVRGSDIAYRNHKSVVFAIEVNGTFAGAIDLHAIELGDHCAEIGYWVEQSFRGQGVCTSAVKTLIAFAIDVMKFRRLEGLADYNNIASQRVMERAGMVREALLRNKVTKPNGDQIDMVLLAKTWEK